MEEWYQSVMGGYDRVAVDRAKSINLELANAYITGAVEADARMKVLARWLPPALAACSCEPLAH